MNWLFRTTSFASRRPVLDFYLVVFLQLDLWCDFGLLVLIFLKMFLWTTRNQSLKHIDWVGLGSLGRVFHDFSGS